LPSGTRLAKGKFGEGSKVTRHAYNFILPFSGRAAIPFSQSRKIGG
jgi:hypothetical protein